MLYVVAGRTPNGDTMNFNVDIPSPQFPSLNSVKSYLAQREIIFLDAKMRNGAVGSTGYQDSGASKRANSGLKGYYFNDPSGYGSWWVPDGYTSETSPYNPNNPMVRKTINTTDPGTGKPLISTPYTGDSGNVPLEIITANLKSYVPKDPVIIQKRTDGPETKLPQSVTANIPGASGKVYRLLLKNPAGGPFIESGATYPMCSRDNPDGCKPIEFANKDDAVYYSNNHNEIPIWVNSAEQAWNIIEGKEPIPSQTSIGTLLLLALPFIGKLLKR